MAINFPDSPSNGDTFTANGKTFVYNSTNTSWRPQTAAESGGTDVLADMAALIAKTGMSNGDQALVQSNNNLYMYSGSGWYKIATIQNDAPSAITGVDGSYALATDGAATTITAVSTDPEGFALTWSYTASGLGSIATVSQADNVFTVTPSTDAANVGSFTLTISATDGINGAVSTVPSFTLAFIVQNSRYTALSVKATNTGSNQTFDDASASNHTITASGDTTSSTFSPYRHGGYSAYFDGSGDALNLNGDAEFAFGTNDFTVEFWVYLITGGATTVFCDFRPSGVNGTYTTLFLHTDNTIRYLHQGGAGITSTSTIPLNAWSHVALTRSGNDVKLFINGQQEGSTFTNSLSQLVGANGPFFGSSAAGQFFLNGYMSDIRILNGTAAYTSNFTPPTEPLTAITNTKFLLGQLPYFKDQSTSNHAITVVGNTSLKPKSLFDNAPYSEAAHGASAYFDGTGDYISTANHADFNVGSSDFTFECWAYIESINGNAGLCGLYNTSTNQRSYLIYQTASSAHFGVAMSSDGTFESGSGIDSNVNIIEYLNQWVHLALTKSGTNATLYLNGNSIGTTSSAPSTLHASTASFVVGKTAGIDTHTTGYFSDVRLVNGSVVYSSNFTPPTAPLTAITNTKFLLNPETSISDLSQRNALICRGDVETSTTQVKFAGTKSIYFAGTDDYIHVPNSGTNSVFSLNSTKFTIEGWFYKETNGNWDVIISKYRWANNLGWSFDHLSGGNFRFRYSTDGSNSTDLTTSLSSQLLTGSWAHVALVANNNLKLYINGVGEVLSASALPAFFDTSYDALIGALRNDNTDNNDGAKIMEYNGWMQDLRIHNNHAQYTADFTPPTQELEG